METDQVVILETNVDDVSPEILGAVMTDAFFHGVLDAWATPILMKKNRPATMISLMVEPEKAVKMSDWLMEQTGSFGVRSTEWRRRKLERQIITVETECGPVEVKIGRDAGHVMVFSPEYESCRKLAVEKNIPLRHVYEALWKARQGL